jgi:hypothetical protein
MSDLLSQLTTADVNEVHAAKPEPLDTRKTSRVAPADEYYIVTTQDGRTVGRIEVPGDFCPTDTSTNCEFPADSKHEYAYHWENGWITHMPCGRPTRKWWDSSFRELVTVENEELLLW